MLSATSKNTIQKRSKLEFKSTETKKSVTLCSQSSQPTRKVKPIILSKDYNIEGHAFTQARCCSLKILHLSIQIEGEGGREGEQSKVKQIRPKNCLFLANFTLPPSTLPPSSIHSPSFPPSSKCVLSGDQELPHYTLLQMSQLLQFFLIPTIYAL